MSSYSEFVSHHWLERRMLWQACLVDMTVHRHDDHVESDQFLYLSACRVCVDQLEGMRVLTHLILELDTTPDTPAQGVFMNILDSLSREPS